MAGRFSNFGVGGGLEGLAGWVGWLGLLAGGASKGKHKLGGDLNLSDRH